MQTRWKVFCSKNVGLTKRSESPMGILHPTGFTQVILTSSGKSNGGSPSSPEGLRRAIEWTAVRMNSIFVTSDPKEKRNQHQNIYFTPNISEYRFLLVFLCKESSEFNPLHSLFAHFLQIRATLLNLPLNGNLISTGIFPIALVMTSLLKAAC